MGSGERNPPWSVSDGVKTISAAPEALMADINSAISALEYGRATSLLRSPSPVVKNKSSDKNSTIRYDAKKAEEAYKSGMASMAAGKLDEAIQSLNLALSRCPPDRKFAVAKLQSLISRSYQQLQNSSS